jgi:hypothetical protein
MLMATTVSTRVASMRWPLMRLEPLSANWRVVTASPGRGARRRRFGPATAPRPRGRLRPAPQAGRSCRRRKVLVAQLGEPGPGTKLTKNQVRALVAGLRDIVGTLADADPDDKAELYRELGVNLTYSPGGRVMSRCCRVG